mmetsp:Transcript_33557/g.104610  ORF Transcript_33557/g.104610 Transcript_33557/m.104610 type:complete len:373 (-) Transcript_33557:12-1130(-)
MFVGCLELLSSVTTCWLLQMSSSPSRSCSGVSLQSTIVKSSKVNSSPGLCRTTCDGTRCGLLLLPARTSEAKSVVLPTFGLPAWRMSKSASRTAFPRSRPAGRSAGIGGAHREDMAGFETFGTSRSGFSANAIVRASGSSQSASGCSLVSEKDLLRLMSCALIPSPCRSPSWKSRATDNLVLLSLLLLLGPSGTSSLEEAVPGLRASQSSARVRASSSATPSGKGSTFDAKLLLLPLRRPPFVAQGMWHSCKANPFDAVLDKLPLEEHADIDRRLDCVLADPVETREDSPERKNSEEAPNFMGPRSDDVHDRDVGPARPASPARAVESASPAESVGDELDSQSVRLQRRASGYQAETSARGSGASCGHCEGM